MRRLLKYLFFSVLALVACLTAIALYLQVTDDPNWHVETNASKSESHPLAGFWKSENCDDEWGLAIGPLDENLYYVSFCGPGGCFAEGTYRPNTRFINDPNYDPAKVDVKGLKLLGDRQITYCPHVFSADFSKTDFTCVTFHLRSMLSTVAVNGDGGI